MSLVSTAYPIPGALLILPIGDTRRVEQGEYCVLGGRTSHQDQDHEREAYREDVCEAHAVGQPHVVEQAQRGDGEEVDCNDEEAEGSREVGVLLEDVVEERVEKQEEAAEEPQERVLVQVFPQGQKVVEPLRPGELCLVHEETEDG